jgi:transposase-like protein
MKIPEKKKSQGKYDPQLKVAIAREYLASDLGYKSLSNKYNIPHTTIIGFIKWYREKYLTGAVDLTSPLMNDKPGDDTALRITALEMLIENASKELGVDLVKKFGTKQPKK